MNPTWQVGRSAAEAAASPGRRSARRSHTRKPSNRCSISAFRGATTAEVTGKGYDRTTTTRRAPALTFNDFALPGDCDGTKSGRYRG
ncbi:hypothetical protein MRX96_005084 [Rhipicephalus microplus]